jgi:hypothetical protein
MNLSHNLSFSRDAFENRVPILGRDQRIRLISLRYICGIRLGTSHRFQAHVTLVDSIPNWGSNVATFIHDKKIARMRRTLSWLEQDASLLAMRVKDLSPERQRVAKSFAASMIDQTRAELERLMEDRLEEVWDLESPCEPAD